MIGCSTDVGLESLFSSLSDLATLGVEPELAPVLVVDFLEECVDEEAVWPSRSMDALR